MQFQRSRVGKNRRLTMLYLTDKQGGDWVRYPLQARFALRNYALLILVTIELSDVERGDPAMLDPDQFSFFKHL